MNRNYLRNRKLDLVERNTAQLAIISPEIPTPDEMLLLQDPFDYLYHIQSLINLLDAVSKKLTTSGSLILHHNVLPLNLPLNTPTQWTPTRLRLNQFIAWDRQQNTLNHPDFFHNVVDCVWWFVATKNYKFYKRWKANLIQGDEERFIEEMVLSFTDKEELVLGNKRFEQQVRDMNRWFCEVD